MTTRLPQIPPSTADTLVVRGTGRRDRIPPGHADVIRAAARLGVGVRDVRALQRAGHLTPVAVTLREYTLFTIANVEEARPAALLLARSAADVPRRRGRAPAPPPYTAADYAAFRAQLEAGATVDAATRALALHPEAVQHMLRAFARIEPLFAVTPAAVDAINALGLDGERVTDADSFAEAIRAIAAVRRCRKCTVGRCLRVCGPCHAAHLAAHAAAHSVAAAPAGSSGANTPART